jgi:hypothetical protein
MDRKFANSFCEKLHLQHDFCSLIPHMLAKKSKNENLPTVFAIFVGRISIKEEFWQQKSKKGGIYEPNNVHYAKNVGRI